MFEIYSGQNKAALKRTKRSFWIFIKVFTGIFLLIRKKTEIFSIFFKTIHPRQISWWPQGLWLSKPHVIFSPMTRKKTSSFWNASMLRFMLSKKPVLCTYSAVTMLLFRICRESGFLRHPLQRANMYCSETQTQAFWIQGGRIRWCRRYES